MIRSPKGIDWSFLVFKLARALGSQQAIAKRVGCGRVCVTDIARGKTALPRLDIALALLALYSEHVEYVPGAMELAQRIIGGPEK